MWLRIHNNGSRELQSMWIRIWDLAEHMPHRQLSHLIHVVVCWDGKVGIVGGGPELVAGHHEEDEGGHLLEHLVQPRVLNSKHILSNELFWSRLILSNKHK